MNKLSKILSLSFLIGLPTLTWADNLASAESSAIAAKLLAAGSGRIKCTANLRCSLSATGQFYRNESAQMVWSRNAKLLPIASEFIQVVAKSYQDGLDPNDYHTPQLEALLGQITASQSADPKLLADFDVTLSDAFLLYSKHMVYGRLDNTLSYPEWIISKRSANLQQLLTKVVTTQQLQATLASITPNFASYTQLKQQLHAYQQVAVAGGWESIPLGASLVNGSKGKRVNFLIARLEATGELAREPHATSYNSRVVTAIKDFQATHGLKASGKVDKKTLQALNVPLEMRLKVLELNLDRLRWLPLDLGNPYVQVNIPDFSLSVVENGKTSLSMPVIVGKDTNRSCILSSQITYLEINPYWNIPDSIARKELLPKLQKNPNYLAAQQMKVYTSYGDDGKEVDPLKVNWNNISPDGLVYKFRQMPGDKNALGKVKFMFPNACGIYLHDTPSRNLFGRSRRDFSHGCIRIGKPIEMADFLLADKPEWSQARIESQINSGTRRVVSLLNPVAVHILYATAWVDDDGKLQWRNDIYQIDQVDYPVYFPNEAALILNGGKH